ncbi:MAG: acyl-CoA thioesterase domain-containing protein, partial [Thermoleophilaceae bacterium]
MPGAFFAQDGAALVPSEATRGPWDPRAQHAGPPAALLAREIERCGPREGMRVGRITVEILGPVPLEPLAVEARLVRPGRSVEMLEASLSGPGGEAMRARAWRLKAGELRIDAGEERRPPGPDGGAPGDLPVAGDDFGYHAAMEYSFVSGGFSEPGPATVWMRMR